MDHGVVRLLATLGSDEIIVKDAQTSYNSSTKKTSDIRTLIRYLVRHKHNGPLEMGIVKFYLKIPIFVMRQLVRHRTASMNEVSARYSELPNEFYVPEVEDLGAQSETNKQGRQNVTDLDFAKSAQSIIELNNKRSWDYYQYMLNDADVSREMARSVLPVNIYTEVVWQANLRNFLAMCLLRIDTHAQKEIRVMAQAMYDLAKPHFPLTCQAFEDYIQNAHTLSVQDQQLLMIVVRTQQLPTLEAAQSLGMSKREWAEFNTWATDLLLPKAN